MTSYNHHSHNHNHAHPENDFYGVFIQELNDTLNAPRLKLDKYPSCQVPMMFWTDHDCYLLMELARTTPDVVEHLPKLKVASDPGSTDFFYERLKNIAHTARMEAAASGGNFAVIRKLSEDLSHKVPMPWHAPGWEMQCNPGEIMRGNSVNTNSNNLCASSSTQAPKFLSHWPSVAGHGHQHQPGILCSVSTPCLSGLPTSAMNLQFPKKSQPQLFSQFRTNQIMGTSLQQHNLFTNTNMNESIARNMCEPKPYPLNEEFLTTQDEYFMGPTHKIQHDTDNLSLWEDLEQIKQKLSFNASEVTSGEMGRIQNVNLASKQNQNQCQSQNPGLLSFSRVIAPPTSQSQQLSQQSQCQSQQSASTITWTSSSSIENSSHSLYTQLQSSQNLPRCGQGRYWPRQCNSRGCSSMESTQFTKLGQHYPSYVRTNKPLGTNKPQTYQCRIHNEGGINSNIIGASSSRSSSDSSPETPREGYLCVFCKGNNEPEAIYKSHPLRLNNIVICPSLRNYTCCICKATGDNAHTIKYCPFNKRGFFATRSHEKCNSNNNSRIKMKVQIIDGMNVNVRSTSTSGSVSQSQRQELDSELFHQRNFQPISMDHSYDMNNDMEDDDSEMMHLDDSGDDDYDNDRNSPPMKLIISVEKPGMTMTNTCKYSR